jgi:hypothetical protein
LFFFWLGSSLIGDIEKVVKEDSELKRKILALEREIDELEQEIEGVKARVKLENKPQRDENNNEELAQLRENTNLLFANLSDLRKKENLLLKVKARLEKRQQHLREASGRVFMFLSVLVTFVAGVVQAKRKPQLEWNRLFDLLGCKVRDTHGINDDTCKLTDRDGTKHYPDFRLSTDQQFCGKSLFGLLS